jgi:hypothetical protein
MSAQLSFWDFAFDEECFPFEDEWWEWLEEDISVSVSSDSDSDIGF